MQEIKQAIKDIISKPDTGYPRNNVAYTVIGKDKEQLYERQACFYSLTTYCKNMPNCTGMKYSYYSELPKETQLAWIKLAKQHGLLFDNKQTPQEIMEKGFILEWNDKSSLDKIYIALCTIRDMDEHALFVTNVVKLVSLGINFWHAYVFLHGINIKSTGHTWLGYDANGYAVGGFSPNARRDANIPIWLKNKIEELNNTNGHLPHILQAASIRVNSLIYKDQKPKLVKDDMAFFEPEVISLFKCDCDDIEGHIGKDNFEKVEPKKEVKYSPDWIV